jgi:hypothetical protein
VFLKRLKATSTLSSLPEGEDEQGILLHDGWRHTKCACIPSSVNATAPRKTSKSRAKSSILRTDVPSSQHTMRLPRQAWCLVEHVRTDGDPRRRGNKHQERGLLAQLPIVCPLRPGTQERGPRLYQAGVGSRRDQLDAFLASGNPPRVSRQPTACASSTGTVSLTVAGLPVFVA